MSDTEVTVTTWKTRLAAVGSWLLTWSHAHTAASAAIMGFVGGWLIGKVL